MFIFFHLRLYIFWIEEICGYAEKYNLENVDLIRREISTVNSFSTEKLSFNDYKSCTYTDKPFDCKYYYSRNFGLLRGL